MLTLGEFGLYGFEVVYENYQGVRGSSTTEIQTLSTEAPSISFQKDV
jgi:hypothetical protein